MIEPTGSLYAPPLLRGDSSVVHGITRVDHGWHGSPKQVIDGIIDQSPDTLHVYLEDPTGTFLKGPSPLELYFRSLIAPELIETGLDSGQGMSPGISMMSCLRDEVRTKKFALGIQEAITHLEDTKQGEISVLDAGCGAAPILGIYATLCSEKVRVVGLEINASSVQAAQQVIQALGLEERVTILHEDATTYQPEKEVDLLLSETMHSGLHGESLVQIMSNLIPYVKKDGIVLPSRVDVKAGITTVEASHRPQGYAVVNGTVEPILDLEWHDVVSYYPGDDLREINARLPFTGNVGDQHHVYMTSEVDIGSRRLSLYQSTITSPVSVYNATSPRNLPLFKRWRGDSGVEIKYTPGGSLSKTGVVV